MIELQSNVSNSIESSQQALSCFKGLLHAGICEKIDLRYINKHSTVFQATVSLLPMVLKKVFSTSAFLTSKRKDQRGHLEKNFKTQETREVIMI